jgi:hypothetical protein
MKMQEFLYRYIWLIRHTPQKYTVSAFLIAKGMGGRKKKNKDEEEKFD